MIPKIIHYIWLGKKPIPKKIQKIINNWYKKCPDYEIKRWDETNLDLECCKFVKEAYQTKHYAFASDALRCEIIYKYGGIYLDIDVKLLKNFDKFLDKKAFCGFEDSSNSVNWGLVLGAEPQNPIVKEVYDFYFKQNFILEDGSYNDITICDRVTDVLKLHGLKNENVYQKLDFIECFPSEYFSPKNQLSGKCKKTNNTVSVHLYLGLWRGSWFRRKILVNVKNLLNIISFGLVGKLYKRIKEKKNVEK